MRRLYPDPAETTPEEQFADLGLPALALAERPYAVSNFATTLDGRAAIEGRSGPIDSRLDTRVLSLLRTQADAVMIGAGTMRAERYGRMVPGAEERALRERLGFEADPLAVIVTNSLELPWDAGLFTSGHGEVLLYTSGDREPPATATPVTVIRDWGGAVDVAAMMADLRQRGVRALLTEGGPKLHAEMIGVGVLDEIFVTVAPKLAGDNLAPTMLDGPLAAVEPLELVWLLESEGELFCRYRLGGG